MSNTQVNNNSGGVGFVGVLQVAFIVLKLMNVISWSWFLVLLPSIIIGGLLVLMLIIILFYVLFR